MLPLSKTPSAYQLRHNLSRQFALMARPSPRKRQRVESSSAELEEPPAVRRKLRGEQVQQRRSRRSTRSREADDDDPNEDEEEYHQLDGDGEEEVDGDGELEIEPEELSVNHANGVDEKKEQNGNADEDDEETPEEAERREIWEMFAEEYHDSK